MTCTSLDKTNLIELKFLGNDSYKWHADMRSKGRKMFLKSCLCVGHIRLLIATRVYKHLRALQYYSVLSLSHSCVSLGWWKDVGRQTAQYSWSEELRWGRCISSSHC